MSKDAFPILLSPLRGWVGSAMRIPWVSPTAICCHRFAAENQNTAEGEWRLPRRLGRAGPPSHWTICYHNSHDESLTF